jgi:hypothetical protein
VESYTESEALLVTKGLQLEKYALSSLGQAIFNEPYPNTS